MKRRDFIHGLAGATLGTGLGSELLNAMALENVRPGVDHDSKDDSLLPGTAPMVAEGDFAFQMVDGIHRFLLDSTGRQVSEREQLWHRDFTSKERYETSVQTNRKHLREIIGVVDPRIGVRLSEKVLALQTAEIAKGTGYTVSTFRRPVFAPVTADSRGLDSEGLLLQPEAQPLARVVAIPDADCTPEMLAGLAPGIAPKAQFARRLAESGIQVVVPFLINRDDTFSGIPGIGMTNMPHREWIYRMAFEAGRHPIGLEVQKVLAAVDWFELQNEALQLPIGVIGHGEGGLLALYSAALDNRIAATVVSGYFQPRENLWKEPIYRDVWAFVREFGDAELAGLVAPRTLIVEACAGPEVDGPPAATTEHQACACPNGKLTTPLLNDVKREFERAKPTFKCLNVEQRLQLIAVEDGKGLPGSDAALDALLGALGVKPGALSACKPPQLTLAGYDSSPRLKRQFDGMVDFIQSLLRKSPDRRKEFWKDADASSIEKWRKSTEPYRDYIWTEVIGRLPSPTLPPNPRTRKVLDEARFTGYEVMLDVWPEVFAYGILLVPKDLKPGERRPVVVCQHGLEGRPTDVVDPAIDSHFYHHFGATLADEGFIVYAPQNPYTGGDNFRIIQRMGHPLKLSLFSFILGQHEQTLKWLVTQPFVDPERIGFYGLSYGGKTAVRVPPLLDRYALSICSGDFNEWVWKTTNVLAPQSYMLLQEYDMYEFNFANVINYSDLADLMAPRPFMVERGHDDIVGVDGWVAFEYAAVRKFYDKLGIGDRTRIEFFSGPHEIHGVGTFAFLKQQLKWANS